MPDLHIGKLGEVAKNPCEELTCCRDLQGLQYTATASLSPSAHLKVAMQTPVPFGPQVFGFLECFLVSLLGCLL